MAKHTVSMPMFAGIAGAAVLGAAAYALSRRAPRPTPAPAAGPAAGEAEDSPPSTPVAVLRPGVHESGFVPRGGVPDPLEVDLDLDGIFRAPVEVAWDAWTVQSAAEVPPLVSADDADPPEADDLGALWLSRATQSEQSTTESDLEIDIENLPDTSQQSEIEIEIDEDDFQIVKKRASSAG